MKDLLIISCRYANGYADVQFCEQDANGNRYAFESERLTFDPLTTEEEAKQDVTSQLLSIATSRGLELVF